MGKAGVGTEEVGMEGASVPSILAAASAVTTATAAMGINGTAVLQSPIPTSVTASSTVQASNSSSGAEGFRVVRLGKYMGLILAGVLFLLW